MTTNAVVFVEGESDRVALTTLARRLGLDLVDQGIVVTQMGGSSAFRRSIADAITGVNDLVRIGGMCDEAEQHDVVKALTLVGLRTGEDSSDLATIGFFVCRRDLEDELIRAVGPGAVVDTIASQGDGPSLRRLQRQPAWRSRPLHDQLHRFMSSQSGRKVRYARLLIEAVNAADAPAPLLGVLRHAVGPARSRPTRGRPPGYGADDVTVRGS